jgi:hypothetical protein
MTRPTALLCLLLAACNGDPVAPDAGGGDATVRDGGSRDAADLDGGRDDGGASDGSASDGAVSGDTGPSPTPGPYYVGRHDASNPESVRMSWSGTGLLLRFRGTAARVTMNGAARYFTVLVDGAVQPTLAVSGDRNTYDLATGLTDGDHLVELYRRTEGSYGATEI